MSLRNAWKPLLYTVVNVGLGLFIFWHLYTGGWLTNPYYRLNDPDILNLFVAILEPLIILVSIIYWLNRRRWLYRLLFWAFILQCLIGAGFLYVFILFVLTYKPRMM